MSQKSILNFFKATPPKRPLRTGNSSPDKESPAKKVKTDAGDSPVTAAPKQVDVKDRIARQLTITPALSGDVGHSWFIALEQEFRKSYFRGLSAYLVQERKQHTIYPPPDKVFTWTTHGDIKDVKVVIIGQDPYHGPGQAHGLSFSVAKGVQPPPSLLNIFKELKADIKDFEKPSHGDLSGWSKQGVLLLNAVLTVKAGTPNSHANHGWETFTDAVIKWINTNLQHVVFILWGAYAQKKATLVTREHLVLKGVHPSPLSAARGFFGCRHFSKANEYLKEHGRDEIKWKDLD